MIRLQMHNTPLPRSDSGIRITIPDSDRIRVRVRSRCWCPGLGSILNHIRNHMYKNNLSDSIEHFHDKISLKFIITGRRLKC